MKKYFKKYFSELKQEYLKHKVGFIIKSFLRLTVINILIRNIFIFNLENVGLCLLSLLLFTLPSFVESRFNIKIPILLETIIYIFIFAAEILGEMENFYTKVPGWDTALHTVNGFLCAAVGFSLAHILNESKKAKVNFSPFFLALVGFSFSMTIGVLWEFFEFEMDMFLHLDMQKDFVVTTIASINLDPTQSQIPVTINNITQTVIYTANGEIYTIANGYLDIGIIDTMKDLIVNFFGAIIFCIFGFVYESNRDTTNIAKLLIPTRKEDIKRAETNE